MIEVTHVLSKYPRIILFDGVCNFCDASIQRVLLNDKKKLFVMASLQSEVGQSLLHYFDLPSEDFNSFILIDEGNVYSKSSAALKVVGRLAWPWKLCLAAYLFPRFLRDMVYQLIAKNRYRWFGKKESCMLPSPEQRARFIG